jgi:propionaldehyde dehydrogenase
MNINEKDIERIVQEVLKNVEGRLVKNDSSVSSIQMGVFDKIEDAIDASYEAQKEYVRKFKLKDRERFITAIRNACTHQIENFARMVHEETKLGRYEDKILKHKLVIDKTPGTECLQPTAISGDDGLTIIEPAPFGLIGAITPVTNPTETIINNTISMISAGNGVVFNVHPSAKKCCAYAVDLINRVIVDNGGPTNLISMVKEPTMDTVKVLSSSPKVRLLVGTGGTAMVRALLQSGKKVIGAGAGNPPVVVDETADISYAAKQLYMGSSFDNNIICAAEKEVFVVEQVADELIYNMVEAGAYLLNKSQLEQIMNLVLTVDEVPCNNGCVSNMRKEYHINKQWVGKNAGLMLDNIGVAGKSDIKLLICEVPFDHPFVQLEQMMPVLPIVRCRNLDEAIDMAVKAEHGNRHTASMFSTNVNNLTRFAREVETTIFVKNSSTLAGFGFGGEGFATMTIAGPTGEGITCALSFTRQRRCVLGDGGFRII